MKENEEKNVEKKDKLLDLRFYKSSKNLKQIANDLESDDLQQTDINHSFSKCHSKKKISTIITEESLVYNILLEQNPEDGKITRNYEKVSIEIKKIEQKKNLEKLKLKKKISLISHRFDETRNKIINQTKNFKTNNLLTDTELNLRNKKIEMKELTKGQKINFLDLIQKLKIPPEERTITDILSIKPFIEKSNLVKSFYEEFTDTNIVEKLINFCCIEMSYKMFKEGEAIYKIGDIPKEFYSIIFGKVHLIKAIQEENVMTGFEYFCYLMNLKNSDETYLFHKVIHLNIHNYYINENHVDYIHYIYLLNYLKSLKNKETNNITFNQVLDLIRVKPKELGLDISQINSINYLINNIKTVKKNLNFISEQMVQKYSFLNEHSIKKEVITYKNEVHQVLKANDYFGDDLLKEGHALTAVSDDYTEMAVLPIKLYNSEIALLKQVSLENKISNLHSSHFFREMKYEKFKYKYFKLFSLEKYYNGDILFKEGNDINYIYFILEGNVELTSTRSMNDIDDLITFLMKKKKTIKLNNENMSKGESEINLNYSIINSKYDDLVNYLGQKQNNKIMYLTKNEEIGLVSNFLGNKYITSCIVVSKEAKIYKIDVKYINQMLTEQKDCIEEYNQRIDDKLNLSIQRLFKINNIKLIMIDEKINLEKIDKKNSEDIERLITNSSHIKGLVNYNKLNDVLNNQNKNISNSDKENNIKLPFLPKFNKSFKRNNSPKENSKSLKGKKTNLIKMQLNFIDKEEINKNLKEPKSNNRARDNILMTLNNNNSRFNSNNTKKVSKIKLYRNKFKGINNEMLQKLFLTPLAQNDSISTSKTNKNKSNKNSLTLSNDYRVRRKKNHFNPEIQQLITEVEKNHNHPYYEHRTIIRRNMYKIFDDNSDKKKIRIENMKKQIIRLKELKSVHNPKINNEDNYEFYNHILNLK